VLKPRFETDALEDPLEFRQALVRWFSKNAKDYPWRRTCDPYAILVSEVMLQQTQIATVLGKGYYTKFLQTFPDVEVLAGADDAVLLKAWEGLGYYRRVRMLRETARAVIAEHGGVFPEDVEMLMKLPGIGRYTAGALRAFVFGAGGRECGAGDFSADGFFHCGGWGRGDQTDLGMGGGAG
jgi:A/G-specific adenine glycosylase